MITSNLLPPVQITCSLMSTCLYQVRDTPEASMTSPAQRVSIASSCSSTSHDRGSTPAKRKSIGISDANDEENSVGGEDSAMNRSSGDKDAPVDGGGSCGEATYKKIRQVLNMIDK